MDAPRALRLLLICGSLVTFGCTVDYTYPSVRQPAEPEEPREPPQVVDSPSVTPETAAEDDTVNQTILGWIERVNASRSTSRTEGADGSATSDVQHALDVQPAPASAPTSAPAAASQETDTHEEDAARDSESVLRSGQVPASQPALAPARLIALEVYPAGSPSYSAQKTTIEPAMNTPTAASGAPPALREMLARLPPPTPGSFREQLDRRVLAVIAGDYGAARQPLELVTAQQQELATRFVEALIVLREFHAGDEASAATAAADVLRELLAALQTVSDLSMPALKICRAVRGFGQYDPIEPPRFRAGQQNEFVLYCELRDFTSQRQDDGQFLTRFDLTTTIMDSGGGTVLEICDRELTDLCANRRHDCFIPRLVRLPPTMAPGRYVAKVTAVDKLGQKVAENRASFEIAAER